jgi:hypothetical protein
LGIERRSADGIAAQDPGGRLNEARPVGEGRDASEVFGDVLFADQSDWNDLSVAVGHHVPKHRLKLKDSFGVVTERTMSRVGNDQLRLVEPFMQAEVVFGLPAQRRTELSAW